MTIIREPMSAPAAATYQQLRNHLAALKLTTAAEHMPAVLDAAKMDKLTITAALERFLALEVDADAARGLAGRTRFACLPTVTTLVDFDFDAAPGVDKAFIDNLNTCRYPESATNVMLIEPPGVGKTMIDVGLAHASVEGGCRTSFTTTADSPAAATEPRSKAAGPPACASSPDPPGSSSTN